MTISERVAVYLPVVAKEFDALGLPVLVTAGLAHVESFWTPTRRSPVDAPDERLGGAWGLFQMTLDTSRDLGFKGSPEQLYDAATNAHWAAKLMDRNRRVLGNLATSDNLIAAHNCGPGHVLHGSIPSSTANVYVPAVKNAMNLWASAVQSLIA